MGQLPTAYERFVAALDRPAESVPLDEAALCIAAHADPAVDIDGYPTRLDEIAGEIRTPTLDGLVRHLYSSGRFTGNTVDYYDPRNSFLNDVIDRRLGIPITLAVVGLEVGRRIGVPLSGVGMPGHFLLRDKVDPSRRDRVRVIPNFVNIATYKPDPQKSGAKRFAPDGEKLLIHLSNFRPVKRLTDVIEIFDLVQQQVPSKLLLIGDGPDRSQAEWLAVQKGLHDHVVFLGKQDRVREKLALADIMLLPSELESFGLAALEAMACEVVPIATRVGGLPEVVDHGKTGFLSAVGDVKEMAGHAIDLLKNPDLLHTMSAAAREVALTRFCSDKIIPQYEEFYRRVLEKAS
jgi:glycosyltransferase involved in cell wall biosynthesis